MISSERTQNFIVAFVIIATLVSTVFLVSNAQYYSGSYILAGKMEVTLGEVVLGDIDQGNESIYPYLSFIFNFRTDSPVEGDVRLTYIGASISLNDDPLSLTVLDRYLNNDEVRVLHPGYDRNITVGRTINSNTDRTTILDADNTDTWNWNIRLSYSFITFGNADSQVFRTLYFEWTGSTII
jgi:hypothetical protein